MSSFDAAIGTVIENEGGYANDSRDPGGETKYGISKRAYPNLEIKGLTVAQAEQIYERDYWNTLYAQIQSQDIATRLLDHGVTSGTETAVKIIQRAVGVDPDGIFGPATLRAINSKDPEKLLQDFRARRAVYYAEVAMERPAEAAFLLSWMRRAVQ